MSWRGGGGGESAERSSALSSSPLPSDAVRSSLHSGNAGSRRREAVSLASVDGLVNHRGHKRIARGPFGIAPYLLFLAIFLSETVYEVLSMVMFGQLEGSLPLDWLTAQGIGVCGVCSRVLSLRYYGRCSWCCSSFSVRTSLHTNSRPLLHGRLLLVDLLDVNLVRFVLWWLWCESCVLSCVPPTNRSHFPS